MAAGVILTAVGFSLALSENFNDFEMRSVGRWSVGPWSDTKLHMIRSRRALTHDANVILLKRQHLATTVSTQKENPTLFSLFLVRCDTRNRTEMYAALQLVSTYVRYFSKDKFVAALSAGDLSTLSAAEVFLLPSALKMQPELYMVSEAHRLGYRNRRSGTEFKCAAVQLNVALISTTTEASLIENEIESLCSESSLPGNVRLCRLNPGSGSPRKRVVDTDECLQYLAAQQLASHPSVTWVEIRATMRLRNKYATRVVQSKNSSSWTLWEKGLRGEGEVVFFNFDVESASTQLASFDSFRLL
jgi:hypothetical protein